MIGVRSRLTGVRRRPTRMRRRPTMMSSCSSELQPSTGRRLVAAGPTLQPGPPHYRGPVHRDAAAWFARRTSASADWPVPLLVRAKGQARVSGVLPALGAEPTVGEIVAGVRRLADRTGLVDEVLVIDSGSVDRTAAVAARAGATVFHRDEILPGVGSRPGKGEVLWKALHVSTGDI